MLALLKLLNGKKIIGDPKSFSLEERIFNTVLIIAMIAMVFEIPFNFIIGLFVPASLCVFGLFLACFLYYLSRFKRKTSSAIVVFCISCNVVFTINYFFNSGIYGPNLLLFSLIFLLTVAIISKNQFKIWLPINFGIVCAILVVEYFNPHFAKNVYINEFSKSIDFGITYLVTVTLTYFTISYIRKNYDDERSSVLDKNIAIEGQRQELERLNAEKDKLFSIVTHDVRTPLNSIQGYLEVLADADLDEDERTLLKQQLLQITRDTSAMLTNVLSWSKTQMEGARADLKPLNVKDALDKGLTIETNIAARKGVSFNIESEEQLDIVADHNMFQLVIRNLVNNAIKFTPKGGSVNIKAGKELSRCRIVIEDTGLGISSAQQQHLFKLNASSTYGTNNERGIGLGLLLCKEFTELQGGEIWFESAAGKGSSFYVEFDLISE